MEGKYNLRIRRLLLTILCFACILPALYFSALEVQMPTPSRELQYSEAAETTPSTTEINSILASLAGYVNPSDLQRLRAYLRGITPVAASQSDPMGHYLWALSELTGNLTTIDSTLKDANTALASGHVKAANSDLVLLIKLRSNSHSLFKILYSSLTSIHSEYGVDTSQQSHAVNQLDARLQYDSTEMDDLSSTVNHSLGALNTILSMSVSESNVLVGQNFSLRGFLTQSNGTALGGRTVAISWGTSQTRRLLTDELGQFAGNLSYPVGTATGEETITATFEPEGPDAVTYLRSTTFVLVNVHYRPSSMVLSVFPRSAKPSDSVQVMGNLSAFGVGPLQRRMIDVYLDRSYLGNATTNGAGAFSLRFTVPEVGNGTHILVAMFNPIADVYGPSSASMPINVTLVETRVLFQAGTVVFSGSTLTINGTVIYVSNSSDNVNSPSSGNITIYFDDRPSGRLSLGVNGMFLDLLQIPLETGFGAHTISVQYNATEPWIASSVSQITLTVYNTPILVFALAAGTVAIVASTLEYMRRRKKSRVVVSIQQELPADESAAKEPSWEEMLSLISAEDEPTRKIRAIFSAAQTLVRSRTREGETVGETPEEFLHRATTTLPSITEPLTAIVELYELAEYAPYPVDESQTRRALESLTQIKADIET